MARSFKSRLLDAVLSPVTVVTVLTLGPAPLLSIKYVRRLTYDISSEVHANLAFYIYSFGCVLAFVGAYFLARLYARRAFGVRPGTSVSQVSDRAFWICAAVVSICSLVGAAVASKMMGESYVKTVFSALTVSELRTFNDTYRTSSDLSLLPGYVRMLNYLNVVSTILAIRICTPIILAHRRLTMRVWGLVVIMFQALLLVYRTLLIGDRWPLVSIGVAAAFVASDTLRKRIVVRFGGKRLLGWTFVCVGALSIGIAVQQAKVLIETLRGGAVSGGSSFFTYVDYTYANSVLAIETATNHTWGFETFLSPLKFVPRAFGKEVHFPETNAAWLENPAGDLLGQSYYDFGFGGMIVYVIYGLWLGVAFEWRLNRTSITAWAFYVYCYFGLLSIFVVPLIRGPEYWAGLLCLLFMTRIVDKHSGGAVQRRHCKKVPPQWATGIGAYRRAPSREIR